MIDDFNIIEFDKITDPLERMFEAYDTDPELIALDEVSYNERAKKAILSLEVLDVEKYIKVNNLKPITNPTFFNSSGMPTTDGLLSTEIFGITQKDRAGTFAYIDLYEYFIDPSCYKTLCKLDSNFKFVVSGIKKFVISKEGYLVEDPEKGNTGIKWLKANFSKITFKRSDSRTRDMYIRYIMHNYKKGRMFINKYIVIPAFYRDVNTTGKNKGVGQINTLYVHLITAANALKENGDYGLSMADTTCMRIQDTLKAIYDWFCGNTNTAIEDKGSGLSGKFGIVRANMSYTSDYSSRLVLSAPELKAETIDDLMVTFDKSNIPLAAAAVNFFPFVLFHLRKYFENQFLNTTTYPIVDKNGNLVDAELDDNIMMYFTDDILKDQLKKFVYSHDNRFIPIEIPLKDKNLKCYMAFNGKHFRGIDEIVNDPEPALQRPMTWVDVIYLAVKKSAEGKQMSFTRYPFDSYFNTIYTEIEISTTTETEQIVIDGEFYRFYPKIRLEDIGKSSAAKFIDTMQISNLYLDAMLGDYDGDTGQVKGSFFKETNEELLKFRYSKANFINLACQNKNISAKEAVQSLYNLTLALPKDRDKLTDPEF